MKDLTEKINEIFKFKLFDRIKVGDLLIGLIVAVICIVAAKLLVMLFNRATKRFDKDRAVQNFIRLLFKVAVYFCAVWIIAGNFGIPTSAFITVVSVCGVAISLSIQDQLANVIGGIVIIINKPFKAGDYIQVAEEYGRVTNITLTYTTLVNWDNLTIFVPNKDASSNNVINFTRQGVRRLVLPVSASYDCKPSDVIAALREALDMTDLLIPDQAPREPEIGVANFGNSSIEYAVDLWCTETTWRTAKYRFYENVKKSFDLHGIEITYDHLNVHMIEKN